MEINEAIDFLCSEELFYIEETAEDNKAKYCAMAISALGKQIPKAPQLKVHEKYKALGKNYYCDCGVKFTDLSTNYCGNCGQRLRG